MKKKLLNLLATYTGFEEEKENIKRLTTFILTKPDCFERTRLDGHVTGSGLVITENYKSILLTHHRKLGMWLQLGGHCDGNPNVHEVALRECEEESGLQSLSLASQQIFDIDIHTIPARKNEPEHLHYDIRYLVTAKDPEKIILSEESTDLKWFTLSEAFRVTKERSMHRQFEKIQKLKSH